MKAQDLRIGNFTDKGKVISFYEHGVHLGMGKCHSFSELKPIQLTEEILLKCGFVAKNIYDDFCLNGIRLQSTVIRCDTNERSSFFLYLGEENEVLNNRIDSLHQLQNIYFALTNEELEINL